MVPSFSKNCCIPAAKQKPYIHKWRLKLYPAGIKA